MATQSSVLAGRIPGTGEPGGLSSLGSHRVGHDWSDLAAEHSKDIFFNILHSENSITYGECSKNNEAKKLSFFSWTVLREYLICKE